MAAHEDLFAPGANAGGGHRGTGVSWDTQYEEDPYSPMAPAVDDPETGVHIPAGHGYRAVPGTTSGYWGGTAPGTHHDANGNVVHDPSGREQDVNRYRGMGEAASQRQAYQVDTSNSSQSRNAQATASALQYQAAMGNAPSQAELLGRNMIDQSLEAQMAAAASARGGALAQAAATRGAASRAAAQRQQGMNNLAALRAQEMATARQAFMQGATGIRGQDLSAAEMQMRSELAQRGLNQQAQMGYEGMGFNVNAAALQAGLNRKAIETGQAKFNQEMELQQQQSDRNFANGLLGAGIGGFGYISNMTSDVRAKDVDADSVSMAGANRSMAPGSYRYKPGFESPGQSPGETNIGPMAQRMAADPVARTAIVQDPRTGVLGIDKEKGLKLVMGGLADLQRQRDEDRAELDALKRRKR